MIYFIYYFLCFDLAGTHRAPENVERVLGGLGEQLATVKKSQIWFRTQSYLLVVKLLHLGVHGAALAGQLANPGTAAEQYWLVLICILFAWSPHSDFAWRNGAFDELLELVEITTIWVITLGTLKGRSLLQFALGLDHFLHFWLARPFRCLLFRMKVLHLGSSLYVGFSLPSFS